MKTFKKFLRLLIVFIPLIIRFIRIFFEIFDTLISKATIKTLKKFNLYETNAKT